MTTKSLFLACLLAGILVTAGCMTMPTPATTPDASRNDPAHQYGEEILAYMMQVVLGTAGDPDRRTKWSSRGLDQDLDLAHISSIMSDPGGNKTAIMVNDPNILGLSRVLYHYAPEMSQFSGTYTTSLYPASELVALRLFLLKRLQDDRKISIQSLLHHQKLLEDSQRQPLPAELAAMNLTVEETRLLQAVFKSKPWLFTSLTNPFLVESFARIGVLGNDPLAVRLIARASYLNTPFAPLGSPFGSASIVIAFLPSMTKEFNPGKVGFNPTDTYREVVETLKKKILLACRQAALQALDNASPFSDVELEKILDQNLDRWVTFRAPNTRPLVIYPENSAKVIRETCPDADFVVIILGRNVYQSMHIDQAKDVFPAVNRIYLDITDIKHSQVSSEAKEIGEFLYRKIKPRLSTVEPSRKAS